MAQEAKLSVKIVPNSEASLAADSNLITVITTETSPQRIIGEGQSAYTESQTSTTRQTFPNPDQLISHYQTERFRGWLVAAGGTIATLIGGAKIVDIFQHGQVLNTDTYDRFGPLSAIIAMGAGVYIFYRGGKIIQRVNAVREKLDQAQRNALRIRID